MAESAFLNCGDDWQETDGSVCDQFSSGMDAAILFKPGIVRADIVTGTGDSEAVDPELVQGLLDSGDAQVINGLRLGLDAPSAVTGDSWVACEKEAVITYDRTLSWKDRKVTRKSITFYNSINASNGFRIGMILVHECAAERITLIEVTSKFTGGRVSPEGDELQRHEYTVSWQSKNDSDILADADVFSLIPAGSSGS